MKKIYLGIDVGSVSTNVIVMDADNSSKISESLYIRTNGQPLKSVGQSFYTLKERGYQNQDILGVGITGSARKFIGNIIKADCIKNEITAHAVAAINRYPNVKTVIEIGGQDSKIIIIENGVVVDFAMNTICAAGTGSFLDQQAFRLDIPIEQFGEFAVKAKSSVRIAGRCTVFAESDMVHKQQQGSSVEEIIAGLCEALVRNYINNVAKGKRIESPVLFQGGVAYNIGIRAALQKELSKELIVPENFDVMGAIGSAVLAKEHYEFHKMPTTFKGFDSLIGNLKMNKKDCTDCTNSCELTEIKIDGSLICILGDRCGKWQV